MNRQIVSVVLFVVVTVFLCNVIDAWCINIMLVRVSIVIIMIFTWEMMRLLFFIVDFIIIVAAGADADANAVASFAFAIVFIVVPIIIMTNFCERYLLFFTIRSKNMAICA